MRKLFLVLIIALVSNAATAVETPGPGASGEFFFDEVEGRKANPNRFLIEHNLQLAYPAQGNSAALAQAAASAWQAYGKIQFRGTGNGQTGVWRTVGPEHEQTPAPFRWSSTSGRVTGLAIGPECNIGRCRIFVATAGGGVWRSDRGLHETNPGWKFLSNGLLSNNIGSIRMDPNDPSGDTLYVGTGEGNFSFTSIAGLGVFRTGNGGDSFERLSTMIIDSDISPDPIDFTTSRGVQAVAVKPGSPDTIYVGTTTSSQGMTSVRGGQVTLTGGDQAKVGLYKTTDGGVSWVLLFEATVDPFSSDGTPEGVFERISGVKDIRFDPQNPNTVWISVADDGVYRSAPDIEPGDDASFKKVFEIVGVVKNDSYAAIELVLKDGATRVYLYNGNGRNVTAQALYRLDDAGMPADSLYNAGNQPAWVNKTQLNDWPDYADWILCGSQCVYDLVVESPEGQPDTVFIAGNLARFTGDAAVYSTDGGENFKGFGADATGLHAAPHVDSRAIVFSPENPDIVFIGSDGGVVRSNGHYADITAVCESGIFGSGSTAENVCLATWDRVPEQFIFMNRGLQTMQLFNISADPQNPMKRIMAGTQDNSTQWTGNSGSIKNWTQIFAQGDGTSANGFHRENSNILFASAQSYNFVTNFTATAGDQNWYWTAGPIAYSDESTYPNQPPGSGRQFITFDPLDADTQFTGFERIWRTRNNGGELVDLQANNCSFDGDYFRPECGDWEALGDYLTRDGFDFDRAGGVIAAAERSAEAGTLWAGTTLGRVFITHNVDADAAEVEFIRVDSAGTPNRFISGITVDSADPNRAFITYSGFSAVTPLTPGHVFEVVYDPGSGTATFTAIDHNLGDVPVNHVVRDDLTGDLYIATDFGVLLLPAGSEEWQLAGKGLPAVLTPHLEIHPEQRKLFAATHGLGGWYMNLPKLKKSK